MHLVDINNNILLERVENGGLRMNLFEALLIGHLAGDFLFQTSWMARYKSSKIVPLTAHVIVYTIFVVLTGGLVDTWLPVWAIAVIFVTHWLIDRFTFGAWWAHTIQGVTREEDAWLRIVADQILHILVLVFVVWMLG